MKLPFDIDLKIVFRVLLPGLVVALALHPLLIGLLDLLGARSYTDTVFVALALVGGWIVLNFDMHIYMLYEGRRYWPRWLSKIFVDREKRRLGRLMDIDARYNRKDGTVTQSEWNEAWFDIRRFPTDQNATPAAVYPTRFGNLLASYENYPSTRYGVDAIFLWPRLLMKLDKESREMIDASQAQADSALYTSFTLFFLGLMYSIYAVLRWRGVAGLGWADQAPILLLAGIALSGFVGGYILYVLDLHPQAAYGDLFMSAFDIMLPSLDFAHVLKIVEGVTGDAQLEAAPSREKLRAVWRYLQYYMVRPRGRNKSMRVPEYEAKKKL